VNYLIILLFILLAGFFNCKKSKNSSSGIPSSPGSVTIEEKVLTSNLNHVWELVWGPDNFIWMTERGGRISRVNPSDGSVTPVYNLTEVVNNNEGGLLGMALHPDFTSQPFVYVAYNYSSTAYKEKIVRYTYDGTTLTRPTILLDNIGASSIHNGCRLLIVQDKLFISTGDASIKEQAQSTNSLNGKILRINLDGSIPSDNPMPNNPVWSWGHRNPQGLVLAGNTLFISEHGPDSDDEINIIEKGRNYGWPDVKGLCNTTAEKNFCSANNVKEPVKTWTPTIATCGLEYYHHDLIPQWKSSLLLATLKNRRLHLLKLNDTKTGFTEETELLRTSARHMHCPGRKSVYRHQQWQQQR
jgi:glucose/arabinose dehydrogenase